MKLAESWLREEGVSKILVESLYTPLREEISHHKVE